MGASARERYTIRRKVLRIFGAGFHIYGSDGTLAGYCDQKRLRLREDLRVYTSEAMTDELLRIGTEQIIDFGATYTVSVPEGGVIGSFRRKGLKSLLRDEWLVLDATGATIATIREDSTFKAVLRRVHELIAVFVPQGYHMVDTAGAEAVTYRTHFNPIVHRLGVTIHREDEVFDDLLSLAGGVLLLAIEGRQG